MTIVKKCLIFSLFTTIGTTFHAAFEEQEVRQEVRKEVGQEVKLCPRRNMFLNPNNLYTEAKKMICVVCFNMNPGHAEQHNPITMLVPEPEHENENIRAEIAKRLIRDKFAHKPTWYYEEINHEKARGIFWERGLEAVYGSRLYQLYKPGHPNIKIQEEKDAEGSMVVHYTQNIEYQGIEAVYCTTNSRGTVQLLIKGSRLYEISDCVLRITRLSQRKLLFQIAESLPPADMIDMLFYQRRHLNAAYAHAASPDNATVEISKKEITPVIAKALDFLELLGEEAQDVSATIIKTAEAEQTSFDVSQKSGVFFFHVNYDKNLPNEIRDVLANLDCEKNKAMSFFPGLDKAFIHVVRELRAIENKKSMKATFDEERARQLAESYPAWRNAAHSLTIIPKDRTLFSAKTHPRPPECTKALCQTEEYTKALCQTELCWNNGF